MNEQLFKIRDYLRLSQSQLAKLLELKQASYSLIESKERNISLKVMDKLINRINVNRDYLEGKDVRMFRIKEPLISKRIALMISTNNLIVGEILKNHPPEMKEKFDLVMKNEYYPDADFIRKVFGSIEGFDVDYVLKGKFWYKDLERELSPKTGDQSDPGVEYITKDKYDKDIETKNEMIRIYQYTLNIQEKRIAELEKLLEKYEE